MKLLLAFLSLSLSFISFGRSDIKERKVLPPVLKISEHVNEDLSEQEAMYRFQIYGLATADTNMVVSVNSDGVYTQYDLDSFDLVIKTTPGKHIFEISYPNEVLGNIYLPTTTDSLEIGAQVEAQYRIQVTAIPATNMIQPIQIDTSIIIQNVFCKPVIYLYPNETQQTSVKVDIRGNTPYFYPKYENGWNVEAKPNGDLNIDGINYRYLFWESTDIDYLTTISVESGYSVAGANAIAFLEEKLDQFGLNSQEKADFITYWGPRMAANAHNLIRFEWNEQCNQFAELTIDPKPENIYRLYIFIAPMDAPVSISPQEIPTINRDGYTVIEWGGQMSIYQPNTSL